MDGYSNCQDDDSNKMVLRRISRFDWNSKDMQTLYRHLEFCQDNNVDVLLTDWGLEVDWLAVDGIRKPMIRNMPR
jgi:hypothetical protein